jgi:hypothetical protein
MDRQPFSLKKRFALIFMKSISHYGIFFPKDRRGDNRVPGGGKAKY